MSVADRPTEKVALARWLRAHPRLVDPSDISTLHHLVTDSDIDPRAVERACWTALRTAGRIPHPDAEPRAVAAWLEDDGLALAVLSETQLTVAGVERQLTALRRWLLLEGQYAAFPKAAQAIIDQTAHNGGVWAIDAAEALRLADQPDFRLAYYPPAEASTVPTHRDPITQKVARQYTDRPYPVWQRAMVGPDETLDAELMRLGCPLPPVGALALVAGCGTGREALRLARKAPNLDVLGIDISQASLDVAVRSCIAKNLQFERHDINELAGLAKTFAHISSSGVLHHLPDPEAGWAALADALEPGGTMRVMIYSRVVRLRIQAARTRIADLLDRPLTDDLLRAARARFMTDPPHAITGSVDFFSAAGVQDLLFNRHEDPFDLPRVDRIIKTLGLRLLEIVLPAGEASSRYLAAHPGEDGLRNLPALQAWEIRHPRWLNMYDIWCQKLP